MLRVKRIFDFALINRTPVPPELKAKYALEGANQIVADLDAIEELGVIPVLGDYLEPGHGGPPPNRSHCRRPDGTG